MNRLGLLPASIILIGLFIGCGTGTPGGDGCDTDGKEYVNQDPQNCERIKFKCDSYSRPFFDDCGCGCERVKERPISSYQSCGPRQKEAANCIQIYKPVCGWSEKPSRCFSPQCRQSYANSCFACVDTRVMGFTDGACPN
mgnify:CR=1 FL=1